MTSMMQDLKYALRTLLKSPAFSAIAVATLAVGIGANAAIFSVLDAALLRPLPYRDAQRLIWVRETQPDLDDCPATAADFLDWNVALKNVELTASENRTSILTGRGEPERVAGARVTPNLFTVLGIRPLLGRTLLPSDATAGGENRVVVGERFWKSRLGRAPIGTVLRLNGQPSELVGVLPQEFDHPQGADVWSPLVLDANQRADRESHYLQILGRLTPGSTLPSAQAEIAQLTARLARTYPATNAGHGARLVTLREELVGPRLRRTLLVLYGAVTLVLLLACVNLGNLLLAKNTARAREMAIRAALGARRRRLVRQLMTESALLSLTGGAAGIALSSLGIDLLAAARPWNLTAAVPVRIDGRLLLSTLVATIGTTLVFGLAPAFALSRGSLYAALSGAGRMTSGLRRARVRSGLAVAQIAIALSLLIGAGLMIRSASRLAGVDLGFSARDALSLRAELSSLPVTLPDAASGQDAARRALVRGVVSAIEAVPGVRGAAFANNLPLSGSGVNGDFKVEGRPDWKPGTDPVAQYRVVTPGYLRLLSIPVRAGRGFGEQDREDAAPVALINEAMAGRFWPGQSPLGRRIKVEWGQDRDWRTIVGVVGSVRGESLDAAPMAEIYFPFAQHPVGETSVLIGTALPPETILEPVRGAIWSVDRDLPVRALVPLSRIVSHSDAHRRFSTTLLTAFGLTALLLASLGVYGVLAQLVSERRREIGIRLTLGAQRSDVFRIIARRGAELTAVGIGIGAVVSFVATRSLGALLYEVSPTDPVTFLALAGVMGGVSLLATVVPARRAMRVDPMVTLRSE